MWKTFTKNGSGKSTYQHIYEIHSNVRWMKESTNGRNGKQQQRMTPAMMDRLSNCKSNCSPIKMLLHINFIQLYQFPMIDDLYSVNWNWDRMSKMISGRFVICSTVVTTYNFNNLSLVLNANEYSPELDWTWNLISSNSRELLERLYISIWKVTEWNILLLFVEWDHSAAFALCREPLEGIHCR